MNRSQISMNLWIGAALVLLNVVLFNLLLRPVAAIRADLTEGDVFSLSPVTEMILENLDEEVRITAYVSATEDLPDDLRPAAPEVLNLLREYAEVGGGLVEFEVVVPEKDPAAEQKANDEYGVQARPFAKRTEREDTIKSFYFSIVVEYAAANHARIDVRDLVRASMFDTERSLELKNVEFEVTRAIKKAIHGFESKKSLFANFDHQLDVKTYITAEADLPESLRKLPATAEKVLTDLAQRSKGKLRYESIPLPPTPEEQAKMARDLGLIGFSLGGKTTFYLWAIVELDGQPFIPLPLLDPDMGQAMSEFALRDAFESLVRRMSPGTLRTIGIAQKSPEMMNPMGMPGREPPPFDALARAFERDHEVRSLDIATMKSVPPEVDVLLVMNARDATPAAVYAIDQFIMRGGRAIFCQDSSNVELRGWGDIAGTAAKSGLEDLLAHWGVKISEDFVLDEECFQFPWPKSGGSGRSAIYYPNWASMPRLGQIAGTLNRDLDFLAGSEFVRMRFPSAIEIEAKPGLKETWLLRSTDESWMQAVASGAAPEFGLHPEFGYAVPAEGRGPKLLATMLEGEFDSYFAEREIPGAVKPESEEKKPEEGETKPEGEKPAEGEEAKKPEAPPQTAPLKKSPPTKLLFFANDDWVDGTEAMLQSNLGPEFGFIDLNGALLKNAVDWLLEDDDLIRIRNRGASFRPLKRLEEGEKKTLIWVNYTAPVLVIGVLGIGLYAMRRNKRPLV